jgi:hypothetical protein
MAVITAYPHTIDLTLTRTSNGCVATLAPGAGWNGTDALFIRSQISDPGDGSRGQGYAGYDSHTLPPTRQHNVRVLVKLNSVNTPQCKWHVARKRDGGVELGGCQRFIVEDRLAAGDHLVRRPLAQQGVCTAFRDSSNNIIMPNLANIDWNAYIGQWVCLEHEANLDTGLYSVYVTTPDGAAVDALWSQVNIATGSPGNPSGSPDLFEAVPGSAEIYAFDGIFFDGPDAVGQGAHICSGVVSNAHIGPPAGFVAATEPEPAPTPEPVPTPIIRAPAYTDNGYDVVTMNGLPVSQHRELKEAFESANRLILNNPDAEVVINPASIRVTLA